MSFSRPVAAEPKPVKAVTASQQAQKNQAQPNRHKPSPLEKLTGSTVVVRLRNGETLRGQYVATSRYEIELLTDSGRVVVFKHAIDVMQAAG